MGLGEGFGVDRGPADHRLVVSDALTDTPVSSVPVVADIGELPPPEPSSRELGDACLREGLLAEAAARFVAHLGEDEDDAPVVRLLALTILLRGEAGHAESVLEEAYRVDPGLAAVAIDRDSLPQRANLRNLVTAAVTRAQRTGTGQSWLVVCVLMQGEGRDEVASRMVARAREAGLEPVIADALAAELATRQ